MRRAFFSLYFYCSWFREILRHYLDKHSEDAFQACNGGGNEVGYDYARYSSSISFSDGAVGMVRNPR